MTSTNDQRSHYGSVDCAVTALCQSTNRCTSFLSPFFLPPYSQLQLPCLPDRRRVAPEQLDMDPLQEDVSWDLAVVLNCFAEHPGAMCMH